MKNQKPKLPDFKFEGGKLLITPEAGAGLTDVEVVHAFCRHFVGDWGDINQSDRKENERALAAGGRLFSEYDSKSGYRFWIITECDRSVTRLLLPDEY